MSLGQNAKVTEGKLDEMQMQHNANLPKCKCNKMQEEQNTMTTKCKCDKIQTMRMKGDRMKLRQNAKIT